MEREDTPLLYSFRRCPYAIRARMAIAQSGVNVQIHEVSLRDKPAAMLAASPKGTVPVLVLSGPQPPENVIAESLDIMHWALSQADPDGWLTVADMAQQNDWIARNDTVFKPLLDRYKYANRHPELTPAAHREAALAGFVNALDAQLAGQAFLFGDQPALADVAIFPFIRQFAGVDRAWFDAAPLAGVQRWLAYWLGAPSFVGVMG
jgi:glutathione S-transferase